jgi:hypothetical protein
MAKSKIPTKAIPQAGNPEPLKIRCMHPPNQNQKIAVFNGKF